MIIGEKMKNIVAQYFWLLLFIALTMAAIIRFLGLGQLSLSDHEAENALQSLSMSNGMAVRIGGQTGYVALTSILFSLFESSDFLARFWPALFGTLLVLVPVLYRKHLGEFTITILAFVIAWEPGLVALSRTADGSIMTITALLVSIGFFVTQRMVLSGVLFGLALISSERFWPLFLVIGAAGLIGFFSSRKSEDSTENLFSNFRNAKWSGFVLAAGITILLVSSIMFLYPNGISGLGSSLTGYLASWKKPTGLEIGNFAMVFLVTQFPVLILAIWRLVIGLIERSNITRFLGIWWGLGLVLHLLNPSLEVLSIALINLPAFIFAAIQLVRFFEKLSIRSRFLAAIEACVTIGLLVFSIINFLNMVNYPPMDPTATRDRMLGMVLPLILWIVFTILLGWGWDMVSTRTGLALGLIVLFGYLLGASGWKAAGLGNKPENELFISSGIVIGDNVLLSAVKNVSLWNTGQANGIDISTVGINSQSITWALRNFDRQSSSAAFPINDGASIIVSSTESIFQSQTDYRGQPVVWSKQPALSQMVWQDWIKWFFFRTVPQQSESVLLWVKNDLFPDATNTLQTP